MMFGCQRRPRAASTTSTCLIVGAGLSGIGAGHQFGADVPGKTYAILEARARDRRHLEPVQLSRCPVGLRHAHPRLPVQAVDAEKAIADGPAILDYVRETARDGDVERHIRFGKRAVRANWSYADARWTVDVEDVDTGEVTQLTCGFLFMCSGYYRYDEGYTPDFAGVEDFAGQIVHPQHWPDDLDYTRQAGRRDRQWRDGGDPRARDGGRGRARHDAAALADVHRALPEKDRLANSLRRVLPDKLGLRDHPLEERAAGHGQLPAQPPPAARHEEHASARCIEQQLPAEHDSTTHFTPTLQPVGPAAVRRAGRRPVQRAASRARRRSSPTTSSGSPRPASG